MPSGANFPSNVHTISPLTYLQPTTVGEFKPNNPASNQLSIFSKFDKRNLEKQNLMTWAVTVRGTISPHCCDSDSNINNMEYTR